MNRFLLVPFLSAVAASGHAATIVSPTEDVMTSAFFQGANLVRGYAGDARPTFRVSSDNAFGVGPETVYLSFDPSVVSGFVAPIGRATLRVESADGGFGANAGPGNPFLVSAHGVDSDPFTSITDDTNPGGPIAWDDFFANNVLPADPSAITAVEKFGAIRFDVTSVVNDWISGANTVFALAITGKNDPQLANMGAGFLHGFLNNTETPGSTFLVINQVPEPSSVLLFACVGVGLGMWIVRPSRGALRFC